MKTHQHISALLVVASALLSSCELLVPSPLHYPRPHPYFADHESSSFEGSPYRHKVYNGLFEVPAEGGIYKFNCADDRFFISRVFDSSMPLPHNHSNSNCRCGQTTSNYISVNDLTYSGSFYTITCNKDEHNWVIKVDPLTATSGEFNDREVWVFMWDGSDNSNFVFKFEQADEDSYGYIE